jgi:hypothetical protein
VHDCEFFLCFLIDEKMVTELMILKRATRVAYMPYLSFTFACTHKMESCLYRSYAWAWCYTADGPVKIR